MPLLPPQPEHLPESADLPDARPAPHLASGIVLDRRAFLGAVFAAGAARVSAAPAPQPTAELRQMTELLDNVTARLTPAQEEQLLCLIAKRRSLLQTLRRRSAAPGDAQALAAEAALDSYHFQKTRREILALGYSQPPWLDAIALPDEPQIHPHPYLQRVAHRKPEHMSQDVWTQAPFWLQWREAAALYFADKERCIETELHQAEARGDRTAARKVRERLDAFFKKRASDLKILFKNEDRYR